MKYLITLAPVFFMLACSQNLETFAGDLETLRQDADKMKKRMIVVNGYLENDQEGRAPNGSGAILNETNEANKIKNSLNKDIVIGYPKTLEGVGPIDASFCYGKYVTFVGEVTSVEDNYVLLLAHNLTTEDGGKTVSCDILTEWTSE